MFTAFIWQTDRAIAILHRYPMKFLCRMLNVTNITLAKLTLGFHFVVLSFIFLAFGAPVDTIIYFVIENCMVAIYLMGCEAYSKTLRDQTDVAVVPIQPQLITLGKFIRTLKFLYYFLSIAIDLNVLWKAGWIGLFLAIVFLASPASMYFATNTTPRRPSRTKILIRKTRKLLEEIRHWQPAPSPVPRPFGV